MTYKHPKVSVLIPTYNAVGFIKNTLDAVLKQTFQDFEIVIIDDASTDETENIIRSFSDSRIRFFKNEKNLGITDTRNKLCSKALGEYIAVLDHDDICLPKRLEEEVKFLDEHPDISMVGTYFTLFCPKKSQNFIKRMVINLGWVWCHPKEPTLYDALKGNVLMHTTSMYRRSDFEDIHYRKEYSPAEDYDLVLQALKKGLKLVNIPKVLLKYNYYGFNCSLVQKEKMQKVDTKIKEELVSYLGFQNYKPYPYWKTILSKLRLKYFKGL